MGAFIGSGGGLSLYEPEPAYQQGVQSTGSRTTPDVSLVADPATGAWIADPYNLDPSDPFEVVGGTSLSAPAWAGLLALVNQGSAGRGWIRLEQREPDRGPASPLQPAAERLQRHQQRHQRLHRGGRLQPGDRAGHAGGEPRGIRPGRLPIRHVRSLGPDGRPVAECQPGQHGSGGGGTINVFSVFDIMTIASDGLGSARPPGNTTDPSAMMNMTTAPAAANQAPTTSFLAQNGHGLGIGTQTNPSPIAAMSLSTGGVTVVPIRTCLGSRQPARPNAVPVVLTSTSSDPGHSTRFQRMDHDSVLSLIPARFRAGRSTDSVLDDLAVSAVLSRGTSSHGTTGTLAARVLPEIPDTQAGPGETRSDDPGVNPVRSEQPAGFTARLAAILLALGYGGHGARTMTPRNPRAERAAREERTSRGKKSESRHRSG